MFNKVKIEYIYLTIALFFGALFIFLIPPFQSPDEDSHFKKSYMVSTGHFLPEDNGEHIGNYFPSNMLVYIDGKLSYIGNRDKKYSYSSNVLDNQTLVKSDDKTFVNYSTVGVNPLIYVIPALGIIMAKVVSVIIGLPITITNLLYGGRILSLLMYTLITFFAIKTTPRFKRSMTAIALMPMSIFLYSCISYDPLLISMTFLLFSIALKYKFDNKISKISNKDLFLIALIVLIYVNLKYIYSLNLLILFIIPKNKILLEDKKKTLKKYGTWLFLVVLAYFIIKIPNYMVNVSKYSTSSAIISKQKSFVLSHPFDYIGIYFKELFGNRFAYISGFVGTLGLIDTFLPIFIIIGYILFIILSFIVDGSEYNKNLNILHKVIAFLIPFGIISLAFLGMYICWTPLVIGVKANRISGVQGRYFIPAILMLQFVFVNKFKFKKLTKFYDNFCPIFYIFMSFTVLFNILLRYWI